MTITIKTQRLFCEVCGKYTIYQLLYELERKEVYKCLKCNIATREYTVR